MCKSTELSPGLTRVPLRVEDGKSPETAEESWGPSRGPSWGPSRGPSRGSTRLQGPERNHNSAVTKKIQANFLLQNKSMNGKMMINKCYLITRDTLTRSDASYEPRSKGLPQGCHDESIKSIKSTIKKVNKFIISSLCRLINMSTSTSERNFFAI